MLELHYPTNDFLVAFYDRAARYYSITTSLLSQGFLSYDEALMKIRLEIYGLHNQIYKLLLPLERRLSRFNVQIDRSLKVCSSGLIFVVFMSFFRLVFISVPGFGYPTSMPVSIPRYSSSFWSILISWTSLLTIYCLLFDLILYKVFMQ